ncbi:MAG: hypothetical protein LBP85_07105 [Prevotellaceae bacterium]|nr:hypothetical protein [Prevotellaceae bacterium]
MRWYKRKNTQENTKKIVLVEFFTYHSECLYSQLLFLKDSGYKITLVCHVKLQAIVENFNLNIKCLFFDFDKISALFKFRNYLIKNKVTIVILNTAQGSKALKFFLLPFPRFISFYGIIHDTEKILKSKGQKIICQKLKSYYSLAEYIYRPEIKHLTSQYFETAFYPPYPLLKIDKKTDEIWVTIPGAIEYCRRDYEFLLTLARHPALSKTVKFVLLGNYRKREEGKIFIAKIINLKLENRFIYFDSFIDDGLFHSYIVASDFLFPLIHPNTPDAQSYLKYKISGMFPFSQAYSKTMLCHTLFADIKNFNYPILFYNSIDNIIPLINERNRNTDRFIIDFEINRQHYLSILQ